MEFGIFNGVHVPRRFAERDPLWAEHRRLMDNVEHTVAADRAGFKYCWVTEHHFLSEYSHMSDSGPFMAYCAARTERIHLGSGIFNITPPVNHPARIAERVAMLDHLSRGRFEFGVGRGSSTTEMGGFGITDPDLTKQMLDEVLPEFRSMWRDEPYPGHDGRFFSMPARDVLPKPYTRPHPPLWMAAGNPSTFEKAARLGVGVLCFTATGTADGLAPLIEVYKKTIADAEPVGDYVNDNVMVCTGLVCMEDGGRARQVSLRSAGYYHLSLVFRYLDTFPRPEGLPEWPATIPEPTAPELEERIAEGAICVGSPEEVERVVRRFAAAGVDQLVFGTLSSSVSGEDAIESVETFGKHIVPSYDRDPVHSTKRQREAQLGPDPAPPAA